MDYCNAATLCNCICHMHMKNCYHCEWERYHKKSWNQQMEIEKTYEYQRGYYQAMRDVMIFFLWLTNANAQNIENEMRKAIHDLRGSET